MRINLVIICSLEFGCLAIASFIKSWKSMMQDPDRKYAGAHPVYNVLQALLILCFPLGIAAFMLFAVFNTK